MYQSRGRCCRAAEQESIIDSDLLGCPWLHTQAEAVRGINECLVDERNVARKSGVIDGRRILDVSVASFGAGIPRHCSGNEDGRDNPQRLRQARCNLH